MSRDRLAAVRAQRQAAAAAVPGQTHEMTTLISSQRANGSPSEAGAMPSFLSEITSIQDGIDQINANITRISTLHARSINSVDDTSQQDAAQLDNLAAETRALSNALKERIKALERGFTGPDAQMRKNRTAVVRSKFLEALQNYQKVEQEHRVRSRQRVERQVKIVKPDATPEEVAAVADGGGNQIFAQALTSSTRYGESRAAYREVQERQQDLRRMEQTLGELAQLMADMGTLVEQQDEMIKDVEATAREVEDNTQKGLAHTVKAVVHARSYRKGRWICFFIFLFVAAVLAIVLGIVFGRK